MHRRSLAAALATAAVALTACGGQPSASRATLERAAHTTTAFVHLTVQETAGGLHLGTTVDAAIDVVRHDASASLTVELPDQSPLHLTEEVVGGTTYAEVPASEWAGLGLSRGTVRLPAPAGALADGPDQVLHLLLSQAGTASTGRGQVDGEGVERWVLTLGPAQARASLPGGLSGVAGTPVPTGPVAVEADVDDAGRVVRLSASYPTEVADPRTGRATSPVAGRVAMQADFSGYGEAVVAVVAPPADRVVSSPLLAALLGASPGEVAA